MAHVAKWSVVAIMALSLLIGVSRAIIQSVPDEERQTAAGATIITAAFELWVIVACLVWWQP